MKNATDILGASSTIVELFQRESLHRKLTSALGCFRVQSSRCDLAIRSDLDDRTLKHLNKLVRFESSYIV